MKLFNDSKGGINSSLDAVAHAAKMLWVLVKWPFEQIAELAKYVFDFIRGLADSFIERWKARADFVLSLVENLVTRIGGFSPRNSTGHHG